jgi:hypothetical protein
LALDGEVVQGRKTLRISLQKVNRSEIRGQRSELQSHITSEPQEQRAAGSRQQAIRGCQLCLLYVNIEQQNKKPQNDEGITSLFDTPCSIFCGSKNSGSRRLLILVSPDLWCRCSSATDHGQLTACPKVGVRPANVKFGI